jgi:hypothetical protein
LTSIKKATKPTLTVRHHPVQKNMAEMHPVLWSRVTDRRLSQPHVKVAVLSSFEHRSFELAGIPMAFNPQTDLMILNYIANHSLPANAGGIMIYEAGHEGTGLANVKNETMSVA